MRQTVLALGQCDDVVAGLAQRLDLPAADQRHRIIEAARLAPTDGHPFPTPSWQSGPPDAPDRSCSTRDDLRDLPLIERKRRLARLFDRAKRRAIRFVEHLTDDGPTVFEHVCRMGLEGIVSKRTDAPYRSGPSKVWLKSKNPLSEAVRREREEERW